MKMLIASGPRGRSERHVLVVDFVVVVDDDDDDDDDVDDDDVVDEGVYLHDGDVEGDVPSSSRA